MTVENIPWMIQGGKHSASSGRRVLFKAMGGAEGVAGLNDCIVKQAAVANGTVVVTPGGGTMVNRYPGYVGEAYDGQVLTDTVVNIAANGGGATRYDMVVMRIDDWNMPGGQATPATLPTDTVAATKLAVISGVSSTAKTAADAGITSYPAIALARIALPAATSAVTTAMITDLRKVARPRRDGGRYHVQPTANSAIGGSLADFQPQANRTLEIPAWASQVKITGHLSGLKITTADAAGNIQVSFGTLTVSQAFDVINGSRTALTVGNTWDVPAAMRGTSQVLKLRAQRTAGTGVVTSDSYSMIVWDVEFLEVASTT